MTMAASARPWRVVVVDDEPPSRTTLRLLLARSQEFALIAECAHGEEAVTAVRTQSPDVLMLDVQMPGMDGFDVLRTIGPAAVPAVVFVTAYDRYALQAFETHALDYLLKPFSDERFATVLERVRTRLQERSQAAAGRRLAALLTARAPLAGAGQLVVREGGKMLVIPYDDIVWIEAEDYYVCVHAGGQRTLVRMPLKTIAESLDRDRFVRVHRSAIVNLSHVRRVEPVASGDQRLVLRDGTQVRVSRNYRPALEAHLKQSGGP
jgi:two-component system LytT family response regulator